MDASARAAAAEPRSPGPAAPEAALRFAHAVPWPICLVTAVAAALRFTHLGAVAPDPYYDAAVHSMAGSLHNLWFGAFDPGAHLSIDKPPLDLWLQVLSARLFGFGRVALQLPEALAGTAAVPLLYDAVRPLAGRAAGLASAVALALLPASVLTARSDTMDGVMMLALVAALWLTVRALRPGSERTLLLAGAAAGLAFEVKLMEALLALPALVVLFWLGAAAPAVRRMRHLAAAGGVATAVGLGWAVLVSLSPGRRPWPVGSSDGSVWNAMFVFNGFGRAGAAQPGKTGGPGLFRLVEASGWHYDILFGCALVGALALGAAAVSVAGRRSGPPGPRALAVACGVWLVTGLIVFDVARTVHARYFDAVAPAVALAVGCGAATLAGLYGDQVAPRLGLRRLTAGGLALLAIGIYTFRFRPGNVALSVVMLWFAAAGAALLVRAGGGRSSAARWLLAGLLTAVAVLFSAHESLRLIRDHADDSAGLGQLDAGSIRALAGVPGLSATELAVDDPLPLAPLILRDGQPLLPLSSFAGRPLTSVAELATAVRAGRARFALLARPRCTSAPHSPPCLATARWIRAHGTAVALPGLERTERLYRLAR